MNKEEQEAFVNFGAFNYDVKKIASITGMSILELQAHIDNSESEISKLIQRGRDMYDYAIDLKLFEMAKGGDLKAIDKIEMRKTIRERKKN